MRGKGRSGPGSGGMGVGTTALAEGSMPRPPPAEESGEGVFSRGGDADSGGPLGSVRDLRVGRK